MRARLDLAMAIELLPDVERRIFDRSAALGIEPAEYIRRAVDWFANAEAELAAEFKFWQDAGWRAWAKVEELAASLEPIPADESS